MSDVPPQVRCKLTLAYRGTSYHGWQRQIEGGVGGVELPTVQSTLRLALQRVVNHPVVVVGSSRTDAGVHARGQVAHFDTIRTQIPLDRLSYAVNAKLPADVCITRIERVADDFDAIKGTVEKGYRYLIHNGPSKDVFAGDLAFHMPPHPAPLVAPAMHTAAQHLVGEHDFASFAKPGHGRDSTVRTITRCAVSREGKSVFIDIAGTGFLWNQVRIIAGTLLRVGTGLIEADAIPQMLAKRNRLAAGPTAPAYGLYLEWIRYANAE